MSIFLNNVFLDNNLEINNHNLKLGLMEFHKILIVRLLNQSNNFT
jgi:hypothetical protein